jgi:hypothetical protein
LAQLYNPQVVKAKPDRNASTIFSTGEDVRSSGKRVVKTPSAQGLQLGGYGDDGRTYNVKI